MELYNECCLERLKKIPDKSIDLIFNDLPYGQTSCKWDSLIDINELWKQYKRIRKDNTPIFFTCSTKFGVSLINSNPKEFRYDIVWVKSAPCGFLNAKKMPMKKHEMLYVFYKKLPFYDLSSHTHKFLNTKNGMKGKADLCYSSKVKQDQNKQYEPPLPTSVIKEDVYNAKQRFKNGKLKKHPRHLQKGDDPIYDPPLPTSVIKYDCKCNSELYGDTPRNNYKERKNRKSIYNPPLPNSILEISSQKGKHSTQKPVDLMKWILKYYSKEDDKVLDVTMGSGTMGVACKEMNRKFIGIEKDENIFKIAKDRIENI